MKSIWFDRNLSKPHWRLIAASLPLWLALLMPGCQREDTPNTSILMQVGDRIVTVDEYRRDLRVYRTATGADLDEDVTADREMQIRFVRQLAEQLVLLEHAHTLEIEVTDRELDTALVAIQRDYPDNVFEQLLLENAITLEEWKASLRTRLIIERVIQQEIEAHIRISEEDMAQFMSQLRGNRHEAEAGSDADPATPSDKAIVDQLRRSKTETAYAEWVADLKKKYPVDINQAVLNEILAESTTAGNNDANDTRP